MKHLPLLALMATLLAACGQKGALVRPDRPVPSVPAAKAVQTP
jgi:predicted small lipoprotein YifL